MQKFKKIISVFSNSYSKMEIISKKVKKNKEQQNEAASNKEEHKKFIKKSQKEVEN